MESKKRILIGDGSFKALYFTSDLRANEIYAPSFKTGEKVVIVHYPLIRASEMVILKVNNNNKTVETKFGQDSNIVATNPSIADQIPGIDITGDAIFIRPYPIFTISNG